MIEKAKSSQIDQLLAITKACANTMQSLGIFQWNDYYPNAAAFIEDIKRGELYIYLEGNKIVGCIVISTKMDAVYKTVNWLAPTSNNYYIHRLAVHPDSQGRGIARTLMDFAEKLGAENKLVSIRLDTFSQNARNQKFYEARGYIRLDAIYFYNQSEYPFYCYEFLLPKKTS
ncbi:GNAT family N-acetyltransferase [Aequorivita marisscotiae]|uniref:GNAT family N-acetyltransferase n=1 Tax=Aequorivita marisscotiae TaxID=3040348 RepID=A0ABY8KX58_9FLAO|nr:GNAT family N-acetyltransferase [Aequorivita sp. Ant34-E75]WGF93563.1 GNAT family N-acetyltransferase [Aequorivita sp. Ant34-E75]